MPTYNGQQNAYGNSTSGRKQRVLHDVVQYGLNGDETLDVGGNRDV